MCDGEDERTRYNLANDDAVAIGCRVRAAMSLKAGCGACHRAAMRRGMIFLCVCLCVNVLIGEYVSEWGEGGHEHHPPPP